LLLKGFKAGRKVLSLGNPIAKVARLDMTYSPRRSQVGLSVGSPTLGVNAPQSYLQIDENAVQS
jgi:hypothetical protein